MSKRLMTMLVGVAALAILSVGCGDSSSGSEDSLTRAELIKQGDAICKEASTKLAAESEAFRKSKGLKEGASPSEELYFELVEQVYLPSVEKRVEAIEGLNPPSADEGQIEAILLATEEGIATTRKDVKSFFKEDPFKESKELSQRYGFKVCGTS